MMRKRSFLFSVLAGLPLVFFDCGEVQADVYNLVKSDKLFFTNTQHTHFSSVLDLSPDKFSNQSFTKIAQVCWIMDTGECLGANYVGSDIDTPSGGEPDDFHPKDETDCIQEGYTLTSCPEGYKPNKYCLYDNRYFAECVPYCPDGYKYCEDPYYGVGEPCNGMYKECQCDACEGYDYTADNIPDGYVADGEACNSCDGPKYKIKPNPCDGYLDCGSIGCESGATTCLSGTVEMCSDCKDCPFLGTEDTCPPCTVCTYEECSNKYIVTGCKTGCTDYCDYCAFEQ